MWVPEPWLPVFSCTCFCVLGKSWLCSKLQNELSFLPNSIWPQFLEGVLKYLESSPLAPGHPHQESLLKLEFSHFKVGKRRAWMCSVALVPRNRNSLRYLACSQHTAHGTVGRPEPRLPEPDPTSIKARSLKLDRNIVPVSRGTF